VPAKPTPPTETDTEHTPEPATDTDTGAEADTETDTEAVPQNRAARRAKDKRFEPSHVGPRAARPGQGRGFTGRSHSKRP
jgi:hypothetical protein